jgi:hypothetical protein
MANQIGTISYHDQFRIRYAEKISKYLSATSILQEVAPFTEKEMTGEKYVMPIQTRRGHAFTYAASNAGQVTFVDLDTSKIEKASLNGSQIFGGDGCDWESALSALGFTDEFDLVMEGLMDSHRFRIELDTFWGQNAKGSIGVVTGTPATSATSTVTILAAERSAGILYNIENATLEFFNPALNTLRAGTHVVQSVDPDAGTFVVDNSGGTLVDGDIIFLKGQRTTAAWKQAAGLNTWLQNTGTIAGLDASTRSVWKPNVIALGGAPLTFDELLKAANRLQSRGHVGKLVALVSPTTWSQMMSDQAAVVRRTQEQRKYVLGADALSFSTGIGEIEIIAHPYQKEGYAHVFPVTTANADGSMNEKDLESAPIRRIGVTDLCFVGPDGKTSKSKKAQYFEKLQRTNILFVETYSHQALFVAAPSRCVTFTGVDPTA